MEREMNDWPERARFVEEWLKTHSATEIEQEPHICGWMVYGSSLQENAAHQRRHIAAMVDRLGEFRATTVVEIGPGYGAMAEESRCQLDWKRYIGFDFPELAQLQDAYLSSRDLSPIEHVADENELRAALDGCAADLLIACWSLSEMPFILRSRLFSVCRPRRWLIASQLEWGGYDNWTWLKSLMAPDRHVLIETILNIPDSLYCFGEQKNHEDLHRDRK